MPATDTRTTEQPGFAARLRTETWAAHGDAESDGALYELIGGAGGRTLFRTLSTQLYFVYAELEAAAAAMRADAVAGPFAAPELTRLPSLDADLTVLGGPGWRAGARPLPETERYVQRLRAVARDWSGAFVAHHYTRYLGDLSGGLAVGRAARRHLGIGAANGGSFYVFDAIANPAQFKANYRALLDTAPWTADEQDRVVAETLVAYRLNTALQRAVSRSAREAEPEPVA